MFNFHHYISSKGEYNRIKYLYGEQRGCSGNIHYVAKDKSYNLKSMSGAEFWLSAKTSCAGYLLRSLHWFPTLAKLVIGCLFLWLQSGNLKGCPRMIVVTLPQKLWCNRWHSMTESVILLVCPPFELHVTVWLSLIPHLWTAQLAYLLISVLVWMQSNWCLFVCAYVRQGRPRYTAFLPAKAARALNQKINIFTVNMPLIMYPSLSVCPFPFANTSLKIKYLLWPGPVHR